VNPCQANNSEVLPMDSESNGKTAEPHVADDSVPEGRKFVRERVASLKPSPEKATTPRLERLPFRTSREMDFFSVKELTTQTGHEVCEWPFVIAKEFLDNGLDACEDADIAPVLDVTVDAGGISVRDNGPGLPEGTLKGILDFSVRTSSREAYVSPCRGAQGNALKTLVAMPRVIDPERGRFILEAHGKRHVIACGMDPISQRAVVRDEVTDEKCKNEQTLQQEKKHALVTGTEMRIQ
jgi:hypothetical protein